MGNNNKNNNLLTDLHSSLYHNNNHNSFNHRFLSNREFLYNNHQGFHNSSQEFRLLNKEHLSRVYHQEDQVHQGQGRGFPQEEEDLLGQAKAGQDSQETGENL